MSPPSQLMYRLISWSGLSRLQVDQLRDQRVGDARVDGGAEVDDPLGEQVRVDVHDPVAARVLAR